MEWMELYPKGVQPTPEDIAQYIGGGRGLWEDLTGYIETAYQTKPKYAFSGCSGKPGWNVKYQKSGQALGTFYPEEEGFSAMIIIAYRLEPRMAEVYPHLSPELQRQWDAADDFMKNGKWMMLSLRDGRMVEDYKKLLRVKLEPKIAI